VVLLSCINILMICYAYHQMIIITGITMIKDQGLEVLLDLDGMIIDQEGGYWGGNLT